MEAIINTVISVALIVAGVVVLGMLMEAIRDWIERH